MNAFGDKQTSRELAARANVPVPPGSDGMVEDESTARSVAKEIGYPVMIKAVAGGGGRGMRVAHNEVSLLKGFHTARTEAEAAFGNGLLNVKSATWRGLAEAERSRPMLDLIAEHPTLMKRPLIERGDDLYLGWNETTRRALDV